MDNDRALDVTVAFQRIKKTETERMRARLLPLRSQYRPYEPI